MRPDDRPTTLQLAGSVLPDLRIIPGHQVSLHEEADPARVERLTARLRADGVLRNPPVAALGGDGYVVLDGANRTSALRALGLPVVPLQVVDYADPGVRLDVWRHLIVEPVDLPAALGRAGVPLEPQSREAASRALQAREIACYILTGERAYVVPITPSRVLAATLTAVVGTYKSTARIYRVPSEDFDALVQEYGRVSAVVAFPRLSKEDILEIAAAPAKLPTGITRHLIPGRALRLNVPLDALAAPGDVAEKNRWLGQMIRQRLLGNAVRHYPEGAFLFDE